MKTTIHTIQLYEVLLIKLYNLGDTIIKWYIKNSVQSWQMSQYVLFVLL